MEYISPETQMQNGLSRRTVIGIGGSLLSLAALTACSSGQEAKVDFSIGVTCEPNSDVKILSADRISTENYDIEITCLGEDSQKTAPKSIDLVGGSGTVVDDATTKDAEKVRINATYYEGGFNSQDPKILWTTKIDEAPESGRIRILDISELNKVSVQE